MIAAMIATACLALGLVLIVEGLAWALAPSLLERLLDALRSMSLEARRNLGLAALALGVLLVWLAKQIGA